MTSAQPAAGFHLENEGNRFRDLWKGYDLLLENSPEKCPSSFLKSKRRQI